MGIGEEIWKEHVGLMTNNGKYIYQHITNYSKMISYQYVPKGVCTSMMRVFIDEETDTIKSVAILGGCHGNTIAIMNLLKGRSV